MFVSKVTFNGFDEFRWRYKLHAPLCLMRFEGVFCNEFSRQVFMNHPCVLVLFIVTSPFPRSSDLHLNTKHECAIKMLLSFLTSALNNKISAFKHHIYNDKHDAVSLLHIKRALLQLLTILRRTFNTEFLF